MRLATAADAAAIAAMHADCISEGFLVALGAAFLRRLYRRIVSAAGSFAFVAPGERGALDGFVAVAEHTGALYREFLLRDGLVAGLGALPAVLRHPRKVSETLLHGAGGSEHRPGAEILAVAVAATARGHGRGVALVSAAMDELTRRGVTQAHVVTAADNEPAKRMYARCGFQAGPSIELHRGVTQEVMVWSR
jgi:ribosomal protein S18 acetylase RimI-like enzyme